MLEVIYIVRHGYRISWSVDYRTGQYRISGPVPTGIPADPPLVAYGVQQSKQLAEHLVKLNPPVEALLSSPWYRCLQTLSPTIEAMRATGKDVKVPLDNGIADFFGRAPFDHPVPASVQELQEFFDFIDPNYKPSIYPSRKGESQMNVHYRHAYAMHRIIQHYDQMPNGPKTLLICTHAASMICLGRCLTGNLPEDLDTEDFRCGTCALSTYRRRSSPAVDAAQLRDWDPAMPDDIPRLDSWFDGTGVGGGWTCEKNGDCSFLAGGEERTWKFSGDESFIDFGAPSAQPQSLTKHQKL